MTEAPKRLRPGDAAPDFTLPDSEGGRVTLSALRGRRVVVYFYPAALTPGCTKEASDFRDNLAEFAEAGIEVLGISPDEPETLRRFRDSERLTFPLLSDPGAETLRAYGAYGEKQMYGRVTVGVIRTTLVLDADGRVEHAYYNVKATNHVARLRKELGI